MAEFGLAEFLYRWSVVVIVLSGVALMAGVFLIRSGRRVWHMRAMMVASGLATIFIVMYLTRILILQYSLHYVGPARWKDAYFGLLISHTVLASLNLPLGLLALYTAWRGLKAAGDLGHINAPVARSFFNRHRAWVRWTVPVWLYVAATGWIIYLVMERYGAVKGA